MQPVLHSVYKLRYPTPSVNFQARSQNHEKWLLASSSLSVCLSFRPDGTTRLPMEDFRENSHVNIFSKIFRENSAFIKIWQA